MISDSGNCITASNVNIIGTSSVLANEQTTYAYTGIGDVISYEWQIQGGRIQGSSTSNTINVIWGTVGSGLIKLTISTCDGLQIFTSKNITINSVDTCTPVTLNNITGNAFVLGNSIQSYSINIATGSLPITYQWSVSGGVFLTPPKSTDTSVSVIWNASDGNGYVSVTANNCTNQFTTKTSSIIRLNNARTYKCSDTINGQYTPLNLYIYPTYTLDLSNAIGTNVNLNYTTNGRPTQFKLFKNGVLENVDTSGWVGIANYAGQWGETLSTATTGTITFVPEYKAIYSLQVIAGNANTSINATPLDNVFDVKIDCSFIKITSAVPTANINELLVNTIGELPIRWELTDSTSTVVASGNI